MRRIFGKIINEIAQRDKKVVLLVGDIGYGIFDDIRKNNPNQFYNLGICEQSLISFASGLALQGLKPWVYTITPFLIERPFEQVKLDIDQQKANVKLVGNRSGGSPRLRTAVWQLRTSSIRTQLALYPLDPTSRSWEFFPPAHLP